MLPQPPEPDPILTTAPAEPSRGHASSVSTESPALGLPPSGSLASGSLPSASPALPGERVGSQNDSRRDNAFQALWRNPYVRVPVFLLLIYLAYRFFGQVSHVFVLALIAYIVAYLAHPLLRWLTARRIPRFVGVLLVVVVLLGLLALASTLLVTVVTQFSDLVQRLPTLSKDFLIWFHALALRYPFLTSVDDQLKRRR